MFNIITQECPESVNVSGHSLDIETNFKGILKILILLETNNDQEHSCKLALKKFFKDEIPNDIELAIEIFTEFVKFNPNYIDFNEELDIEDEPEDEEDSDDDIFNIVYDSNYIFAAFFQVYKIDLSSVNIHWWKFKALLSGLPGKTKLSDIIEIRSKELPKDSKSRASLSRLKEVYKLPSKDRKDEEQAENAFDALFNWAKS